MYLTKRTYVKNWPHMKPEERHEVLVTKGGKTANIKPERVREISEEVVYWRKANHIHKWFVDNVQGGEDDCKEYVVSREQLTELRDLCRKVLAASKLVPGTVVNGYGYKDGVEEPITEPGNVIKDPTLAKELLPTQGGFFFGSTDYDEYYLADVAETEGMLTAILAEDDAGSYFVYQSSW